MTSLDCALEHIDFYLRQLTSHVGDEEQIGFFKTIIAPAAMKNPDSFLKHYISGSEIAHEGWEKWKTWCSSQTDKICEYEEKLKKCDAYLALMQSILLGKSDTNKNTQASDSPTIAKIDERQLSNQN
jgi:hypothetical protein